MSFDELVQEMITKYGSRVKSDGYVIGYEGKVWRLHADTPLRVLNSIAKEIGYTGPKIWDNSYSFYQTIEDTRPDVFVGKIEGNDTLKISEHHYGHRFTSRMIKKIMDHYDLEYHELESENSDNTSWERGRFFHKSDVGKVDYDRVYHGTCLKYMPRISKIGLAPVPHGNWYNLKYDDRVFLTSHFTEAVFHASRSAKRNNSVPIILELTIPNKDLIIPDADMVNMFKRKELADKHGYQAHMHHGADYGQSKSKIKDINSTTGIFAYRGRIPYKFVHSLYYYNGEFGEDSELDGDSTMYDRLSPENLPIYTQQINDYGMFMGVDYRPDEED